MSASEAPRTCNTCGVELHGRADQRFCSTACRNAWHNEIRRKKEVAVREVNRLLRKNWKILESLNASGKTRVERLQLAAKDFNFHYITETYTTRGGKTYRYCYDQGYLDLGGDQYLLVKRNADNDLGRGIRF